MQRGGGFSVLSDVLTNREEVLVDTDEDGDSFFEPNWAALFHGRDIFSSKYISIGPTDISDKLSIEMSALTEEESREFHIPRDFMRVERLRALKTKVQRRANIAPWLFDSRGEVVSIMPPRFSRSRQLPLGRLLDRDYGIHSRASDPPQSISCESFGPGLLNNFDMARFWDKVALTEFQDRALRALRPIFGDNVEGVAMIGERSRRALVKLKENESPVPFRSLGDGGVAAIRRCLGYSQQPRWIFAH